MTPDLGTLERRGTTQILRFERHYAHPIERVWAAITDPDLIEAWLARAELDLERGGHVRLEWLNTDENGERYEGAIAEGSVTELDPPRLIEYETGVHGVLRWELTEIDDRTRLVLTAVATLPDEEALENLAGWHIHLDFLERALAGERIDWPNWPRDEWAAIHELYLAQAG